MQTVKTIMSAAFEEGRRRVNNQEIRTPRSSPRGECWYRSYQTQGHLELSKGHQATAEEMQEKSPANAMILKAKPPPPLPKFSHVTPFCSFKNSEEAWKPTHPRFHRFLKINSRATSPPPLAGGGRRQWWEEWALFFLNCFW